jgi:hypothetical protein
MGGLAATCVVSADRLTAVMIAAEGCSGTAVAAGGGSFIGLLLGLRQTHYTGAGRGILIYFSFFFAETIAFVTNNVKFRQYFSSPL